jgi:hypothetical protein
VLWRPDTSGHAYAQEMFIRFTTNVHAVNWVWCVCLVRVSVDCVCVAVCKWWCSCVGACEPVLTCVYGCASVRCDARYCAYVWCVAHVPYKGMYACMLVSNTSSVWNEENQTKQTCLDAFNSSVVVADSFSTLDWDLFEDGGDFWGDRLKTKSYSEIEERRILLRSEFANSVSNSEQRHKGSTGRTFATPIFQIFPVHLRRVGKVSLSYKIAKPISKLTASQGSLHFVSLRQIFFLKNKDRRNVRDRKFVRFPSSTQIITHKRRSQSQQRITSPIG